MATVESIRTILERHYPPENAEDWDSVGLICGDPDSSVSTALFALDPTIDVVYEAIDVGAQLIVTHHPLFLSGVDSVSRDTLGGKVVHDAIAHGIAIYNAHTNADRANPGVSDALASAFGLVECVPVVPAEEINTGLGRIGRLPQPMGLAHFAQLVADTLPATASGIRVSGDLDREISMVAVCGGSGDSLLPLVTHLADVYVTSDLKHHKVLDHPSDLCAVIDVAHFASEWPWVSMVAELVRNETQGTVNCVVSTTNTDPWTAHIDRSITP